VENSEIFRLSQINEFIAQTIALNFDEYIWIEAEISQVSQHNGHFYLELIEKDEITGTITARQKAQIWRNNALKIQRKKGIDLAMDLRNGLAVKILGEVRYHTVYGLSIQIEDVDTEYALGKLERQRLKVLAAIKSEKLDEVNKKLTLPPVLQRLAIISSRTAAGYADFIAQLKENRQEIAYQLHLYHTAVQGQNVRSDIEDVLEVITKNKKQYDCICLLRGGGSKIELSVFDDEAIVRALANAPLPVLSGIGHEIDTSLCDIVAHTHYKTPTALANGINERNESFLEELMYYKSVISNNSSNTINRERQLLSNWQQTIYWTAKNRLNAFSQDCKQHTYDLLRDVNSKMSGQKHLLASTKQRLELLDPMHTLKRGFVLVHKKGKLIKSSKQLNKDKKGTLLFSDGSVNIKKDE
jgi:exodeoxyribonuclease VII large subunit